MKRIALVCLTCLYSTTTFAGYDWSQISLPTEPILEQISDPRCTASRTARMECTVLLGMLAQVTSNGREFIAPREQIEASVDVVLGLDRRPILSTSNFALVRFAERKLSPGSVDRVLPKDLVRLAQHDQILIASLAAAGDAPTLPFAQVKNLLIARSRMHLREVAARLYVQQNQLADPYFRLLEASTEELVEGGQVTIGIYPLGERVLLSSVAPLSPLDEAGLGAGDQILSINGRTVNVSNLTEVFRTVQAGSPVRFKISKLDGGVGEIDLGSRQISRPNVASYVVAANERRVGVLSIDTFKDAKVCELVRDELVRLTEQDVDALIYDVRNNPGGYVDQAACVAGLHLGEDVPLLRASLLKTAPGYEQARASHPDENLMVSGVPRAAPRVPTVTLVNSSTASASELFAATLQEREATWIVGNRSFGKGIGQLPLPLVHVPDILAYKTVSRFEQLDGHSVQGYGVEPEFRVYSALPFIKDDRYSVRFLDMAGEAFTSLYRVPVVSVARQRAQARTMSCVRKSKLTVDERTARWLRDRQLRTAVAVALCGVDAGV